MTDLRSRAPQVPTTRDPVRLAAETGRDARARTLLDDTLAAVHVERLLRPPDR